MADVLIYDEATFKVLQYLKSVNTPSYTGRTDVLFNPDMPAGVPLKHLKVSGGLVVEMTQQEKDDLAAAEAAAADASMRTTTKSKMDDLNCPSLASRIVIKMMMDEINILRDLHGLSARTFDQVKTKFKDTVDDKSAD